MSLRAAQPSQNKSQRQQDRGHARHNGQVQNREVEVAPTMTTAICKAAQKRTLGMSNPIAPLNSNAPVK